jgi:hypothetical protein
MYSRWTLGMQPTRRAQGPRAIIGAPPRATATYPSRHNGPDHIVSVPSRPGERWSCTCVASTRWGNDCWAIKEERAKRAAVPA